MNFGDDFLEFADDTNLHHCGFKDAFVQHHHHNHSVNHFASYPSSYYTLTSLCSKPNFLREFTDVRQTEEGLVGLLADFHQNKLRAFGENITFDNMIKVREQQENLARLHFELNSQQSKEQQSPTAPSPTNSDHSSTNSSGNRSYGSNKSNEQQQQQQQQQKPSFRNKKPDDGEPMMMSKPFSKSNMIKLIQNLQNLCKSIELLQLKNCPND